MEAKFTKGEWKVEGCMLHQDEHEDVSLICYKIRTLDGVPVPKTKANLQLQASAPELYGALETMMNIINDSTGINGYHVSGNTAEWDEFYEEITQIESALKKARGEK